MNLAARWIVERQENDGCWGGIQPPPSTRSSPSTSSATTSATPSCGPAWSPSTGSPSGARTVPGWSRPVSRPSGTPASPPSPSPTPGSRPTTRPWSRPSTGCSTRRSPAPGTGRCAGPDSRRAAGRSSSTTTTTPTPTTPPRSCSPCAGSGTPTPPGSGPPPPGARAGPSACSPATAPGAPSTPTTPAPSQQAALLRLRRGRRPALRRRHRPRGGDAGPRGPRPGPPHPAGDRVAARRTGAARRLVRPLGRQPRVRDGLGAPRPRRRGDPRHPPGGTPGRRLARLRTERGRRLGRDLRSYQDEQWVGRGASTASQTAWALLALLAAGERESEPVRRGIAWLVETQLPDGSWDEPYFTGTGFPGTSRSTTTSTGSSSRSRRSAGTCTGSRRPARRADGPRAGPGATAPPLLIACALGIEQLALRSGDRGGAPGPVTVLRTGMGPERAREAVSRALGERRRWDAAVIASGFCAGLAPGMHPGDLVVADETRGPDGTTACTDPDLLVKALVRAVPGRTVHLGPLSGSDHVVRGPERAALRAPARSPSTWSPPRPCVPHGPPGPSGRGRARVRLRPSGWSWTLQNMSWSVLARYAGNISLSRPSCRPSRFLRMAPFFAAPQEVSELWPCRSVSPSGSGPTSSNRSSASATSSR